MGEDNHVSLTIHFSMQNVLFPTHRVPNLKKNHRIKYILVTQDSNTSFVSSIPKRSIISTKDIFYEYSDSNEDHEVEEDHLFDTMEQRYSELLPSTDTLQGGDELGNEAFNLKKSQTDINEA